MAELELKLEYKRVSDSLAFASLRASGPDADIKALYEVLRQDSRILALECVANEPTGRENSVFIEDGHVL